MDQKTFKQQTVQAAIDGLQQGGLPVHVAQSYRTLFEKIFDSGYLECKREYIQQKLDSLNALKATLESNDAKNTIQSKL